MGFAIFSKATLLGLARQRLTQFVVLGAAVFMIAPRNRAPSRVDVDASGLRALHEAQAKKLGVPELDPEKQHEVDARAIEDEILYREAVKLGLDQGDPIVRERMIQKLLMLVEDLGGASREPTDAELGAYFAAHGERYRQPEKLHFVHVYAATREALPAEESIATLEEALASGQAFPYPREQTLDREALARLFGEPFASAVAGLEPEGSAGPLHSSFGWHRVRLLARLPGRPLSMQEAKASLLLDYTLDRRERVVGAYLDRTAKSYEVVVDGKPLAGFRPTRRVAVRQDPSAED